MQKQENMPQPYLWQVSHEIPRKQVMLSRALQTGTMTLLRPTWRLAMARDMRGRSARMRKNVLILGVYDYGGGSF